MIHGRGAHREAPGGVSLGARGDGARAYSIPSP